MAISNLKAAIEGHEKWWNRTNDRPVFYIIYPRAGADPKKFAKPWMAQAICEKWSNWQQELAFGQGLELTRNSGDWKYVDESLEFLDSYADINGHAAEGYSFLLPGLGPVCLAAMISGFSKFTGHTIWVELEQPMEWDKLSDLAALPEPDFVKFAIEGVKKLCRRLQSKYVVATPDMGPGLDVLAALRGTNNLLIDLIDCPEQIEKTLVQVDDIWEKYFKLFSSIIDPGNSGCYTQSMRYLSARPMFISYCDFSAMISPEMFGRFAMPTLKRLGNMFNGRMVYHLDGPGQLPHVDQLLSIETLHSIQWVPGAGNPGTLSEKWYDLYKKIINGGKRICLGGAGPDADGIKKLFARFPKQQFLIPFTLRDAAQAEEIARLA